MSAAGALLAAAILVILLAPWPPPSPEVVIAIFDPRLITVDPKGALRARGRIDVAPREVRIMTAPGAQPTLHLLTAEVPFSAEFTVSVGRREGGEVYPFQFKVWNPRAEVAAEIWYAPDGQIFAGTRRGARWGEVRALARYAIGREDRWQVRREASRLVFSAGDCPACVTYQIDQAQFPQLFAQESLSLTLYASAEQGGASAATVQDPILTVPRQGRYGTRVNSAWFQPAVGALAVLSVFWLWRYRRPGAPRAASPRSLDIATGSGVTPLAVATAVLVVSGWGLAALPGHPIDLSTVRLWSEVARSEGPAGIVGPTLLATEGQAHGGQPYVAMSYPYPPLLSYVFWLTGIAGGPGSIEGGPDSIEGGPDSIERTFKLLMVAAIAACGWLIFAILRLKGISPRLATVAAGAYMLNPAVLFDAAVWGQADAVVTLFLLMGAAGLLLNAPVFVWIGFLLAGLAKQTGAVWGVILVILGLAHFGLRRTALALIPAVIIIFLLLAPLLLDGMHPATTYRPHLTKGLAFGTVSRMEEINAVVSQSGYTLWSLLAGLEGARGWARLAFPDYVHTRLGATYFLLSRLTLLLVLLSVTVAVLRRRGGHPRTVLLACAAFTAGAAVTLTRVSPRYVLFALPFLAAALPWAPAPAGIALAALSTTTLIAMWGMLAFTSLWYPGVLPAFDPGRSWWNAAAAAALGTDAGITAGGLVNLAALLIVIVALWRSGQRGRAIERSR